MWHYLCFTCDGYEVFWRFFFIMSVLKVLLNTLPPRLYNLRWVRKSNMKESQRKKSIWNLNTQSKIEFKTVHYVKWEFQIYDFFFKMDFLFFLYFELCGVCVFLRYLFTCMCTDVRWDFFFFLKRKLRCLHKIYNMWKMVLLKQNGCLNVLKCIFFRDCMYQLTNYTNIIHFAYSTSLPYK